VFIAGRPARPPWHLSDGTVRQNTNPEGARTMRCDGEPVRLEMRTPPSVQGVTATSRLGPFPCIPSGPAVMCTGPIGRTQDCTRPPRLTLKSTLGMREPSTQVIQSLSEPRTSAGQNRPLSVGCRLLGVVRNRGVLRWLALSLCTAPSRAPGFGGRWRRGFAPSATP
jgi:hypothetical protein